MWDYFRKSEGRCYVKWRNEGDRTVHSKRRANWVWTQQYGELPKGYEVHHINFDKTDDRIENLVAMPRKEYRRIHADAIKEHKFIDGIEHRKCQCCNEYKPLEQFYKRNNIYQGYCKQCSKSKFTDWRKSNREKWNEYHREYRKKQL